jgi:hypothetical protein
MADKQFISPEAQLLPATPQQRETQEYNERSGVDFGAPRATYGKPEDILQMLMAILSGGASAQGGGKAIVPPAGSIGIRQAGVKRDNYMTIPTEKLRGEGRSWVKRLIDPDTKQMYTLKPGSKYMKKNAVWYRA